MLTFTFRVRGNGRKIYLVVYQNLLNYFVADDESYPH